MLVFKLDPRHRAFVSGLVRFLILLSHPLRGFGRLGAMDGAGPLLEGITLKHMLSSLLVRLSALAYFRVVSVWKLSLH
jgi:hypothetical protein